MTPSQTLLRVNDTQVSNGLWQQVQLSKETEFLWLKNGDTNIELNITNSYCGTKASIYTTPRCAQNEIVVDLTTAAINRGVRRMIARIERRRAPHQAAA